MNEQHPVSPTRADTNAPDTAHRARILAVDDSRVIRHAMKKILSADYDVVEAGNGEEAWQMLEQDPSIDVIFSDISMPFLDGFGLLDRLRGSEDEYLAAMPVVIVTGKEDDEEAKRKALSHGATDFISKPFDSVQLLAHAKTHVKLEQTTRKLNETEKSLEMEAAIDALTGVGSKRYFMKAAGAVLSHAKRHGTPLVICRLDVDHFDKFFIKNGKNAANSVLGTLGGMLLEQVRDEDNVARLGLASFALLLQSTSLEGAVALAERIREKIAAAAFEHDGFLMHITASIGLSAPEILQETEVEDLLYSAQAQLTAAHQRGGNAVAVAREPAPLEPAGDKLTLDTALEMLERGQQNAVKAQAQALLRSTLPLLDLYAEELDRRLLPLVDQLRESLAQ
jgi:diguanylate cyclase (GGDEF)-like protein